MLKNSLFFVVGAMIALLLGVIVWPTVAQRPSAEDEVTFGRNFGSLGEPYMVPAVAFSPDGEEPDSTHFSFLGGSLQGTAAGYGCVQAPVYFPDRSFPHRMFLSAYDNDDGNDVVVLLRRLDTTTGNVTVLGAVGTAGQSSSAGIRVVNQTLDTVEFTSADYAYYLTTCLESAHVRYYSVRIYYTPEELYLPTIVK